MSGAEPTCPVCNQVLSGDYRCHNPKCRASAEYWEDAEGKRSGEKTPEKSEDESE